MKKQDGSPFLCISIVSFQIDPLVFNQCLESLSSALRCFDEEYPERRIRLVIVDNGGKERQLRSILQQQKRHEIVAADLISSGQNLGYGAGQNMALKKYRAEFFLFMNPDTLLAEDALLRGIETITSQGDIVAVCPEGKSQQGDKLYLCKRYPAVFDLFLRGFAPRFMKKKFRNRMEQYELRDMLKSGSGKEVEIVSGCCLLCRGEAVRLIGGFDEAFFMYFEDFALSVELAKQGRILYEPAMKIIHYGGNTSSKGIKHILMFVSSAWKFFKRYGWRWI